MPLRADTRRPAAGKQALDLLLAAPEQLLEVGRLLAAAGAAAPWSGAASALPAATALTVPRHHETFLGYADSHGLGSRRRSQGELRHSIRSDSSVYIGRSTLRDQP